MSRAKDLSLLKEWKTENNSTHGIEAKTAREYVLEESKKGEIILSKIIHGEKKIEEQKDNHKHLSTIMMQLMYFQFHIKMTLELFSEWDSEELDKKNKQLSENYYLKLAKHCKLYHEIQSAGVIEDILTDILQIRLKDNFNMIESRKVLETCKKIVGYKLLQAKFIKSLKGFGE